MKKGQKTIIMIEVILLIGGLGVFFLVPEKRVDLSDLQALFEDAIKSYNAIQTIDYKIVSTRIDLLDKRSDEIETMFNDPNATYEEASASITMFQRELKEVLNLIEFYEKGLKTLNDTTSQIKKWQTNNRESLNKYERLSTEFNSAKDFLSSIDNKFKTATSMEEIKYSMEKLTEISGKLTYFDSMVMEEQNKDLSKKQQEQAYARRKEELRRKAAAEKERKKLEAERKARELKEQKAKEEAKKETGKTSSAKLSYRAIPEYPERLMEMGFGGQVKIKVTVSKDGKPKNIQVLRSSGNDTLDYNAKTAAEKCRFEPAYQNGEKIEEDFIIPYDFIPED